MTEIVSSASQCPTGTVASRTSFMLGSGYVNSPGECPSNLMAVRIPEYGSKYVSSLSECHESVTIPLRVAIYGLTDSCPNDAMSLDPSGIVCNPGYGVTDAGKCRQLCAAGITVLHAGSLSIPLYATKNTTHTINIGYKSSVCYGSLAPGAAANALNLNLNGDIYHSIK